MSLDRLSASTSATALRFSMEKWGNSAFEKPLSVSQRLARASSADGKSNKSSVQNDSSSLVFSLQQSQLSSNVMSAVSRAGKRLNELQSQKSYTLKQQVVEITTVIRTNMPVAGSVNPEDVILPPEETIPVPITGETQPAPDPEIPPVSVENPPTGSPPVVDTNPVAPGNSGNTNGGAHSAKDNDTDSSVKHHGQGYYKNHGIDEIEYKDKNKGNGKADSTDKAGKNNGKSKDDSTSVVSVVVVSTVEAGGNTSATKASSSLTSTLTMNVTLPTAQTIGSFGGRKPSVSKMVESVETQRIRKVIEQADKEGSLEERTLTRHLEIVSAVLSSDVFSGAVGNTPLDLYMAQDKNLEQPDKAKFTVSESA